MDTTTFDTLIEHVEAGDTLKASIRAAKTSWRALSLHLADDSPEGRAAASRYARARTVSADSYADKAQEAVEQALTPQDAALARVRADVYKWRAGVAAPKVYGDKVDVTSDGKAIRQAVLLMPAERIPDGVFEPLEPEVAQPLALPTVSTVSEPEPVINAS